MQRTGIEYLTHTWSPIKMLCTRISVGCGRCWSLKFAARHAGNKTFSDAVRAAYAGGPPFLDTVELNAPMTMRKPAIIVTLQRP